MGKFDFGDKVRIKNNNFAIDSLIDGHNPEKMYICFNETMRYQLPEADLELIPDEQKKIPTPIMIEDRIATALKGMVDFNANYIVEFHLGHVTVKEISKEDLKFFEDDHDYLNKM